MQHGTPAIALPGIVRWIAVLALQALLAALLFVDLKAPFLLAAVLMVGAAAVVYPEWTVYGTLAARVVTTVATSIRIGPVSIGLFEPLYALAYLVFGIKAMQERRSVFRLTPVTLPLIAFTGYCLISSFWSPDKGDSIHETVIAAIFTGGFILVSSVVREMKHVRQALWVYIAATCGYGILGMILGTSDSTMYTDVEFKIMQGGGRTGGLGQQPNWFAMNLAFAINPGFAFALIQKELWKRWAIVGMTGVTFFAMITSGSRGGTWSVLMGMVWVSLFSPRIRAFLYKYWLIGAALFAVFMTFSLGSYSQSFTRIATQGVGTIIEGDVRISNWAACLQMFKETWGLGIGPGGYEVWIEHINAKVAESNQKYPHGIIWGLIAHQGVFGVAFFALLIARTGRSFFSAWRKVRGTQLEVLLLGTSAAVIGYQCHALIEFEAHDKPFWEFFGLFWALVLLAERLAREPGGLDAFRIEPKARTARSAVRATPVTVPGGAD